MRVEYHIDRDDRIVAVNDDWTTFAAANSGHALVGDAVLGQSIWDHVSDPSTASIYQRMYQRVRDESRTTTFTFRCDAPGERRLFRMQLTPGDEGGVITEVREVTVEPRAPIRALDATCERGEAMTRMCAWCHAIADADGSWLELEDAVRDLEVFHGATPPFVTHTVCPTCRAALEGEIGQLDAP
ncbi:MAG: PAS domain-containing protein [Deltaproteobacteria bacterium]|jgi:hypothetical protein|nr:PAS domain-containing protein [Deltaproteobacteria bacterium]